eukprot:jgi/Chlat1/4444/Chrsp29S04398
MEAAAEEEVRLAREETRGGAEDQEMVEVGVNYRGRQFRLALPAEMSMKDVAGVLAERTGAAASAMRLITKGAPPLLPGGDEHGPMQLAECISSGQTFKLLGPLQSELQQGRDEEERMQQLAGRIASFDAEAARASRRARYEKATFTAPSGEYTFGSYIPLQLPGVELSPPKEKALELMHKLAADPGIVAVMKTHQLAPVGYVGVSPKCLLGYNKNRGQEISLRLRTDDLRGFRKYDSIRKTLLHELAHMVHDEHDANFHALDRQLNREVVELDWTKGASHRLGVSSPSSHPSDSYNDEVLPVPSTSGRVVGGNADAKALGLPAAQAAASAALSRIAAAHSATAMPAAEPVQNTVATQASDETMEGRQPASPSLVQPDSGMPDVSSPEQLRQSEELEGPSVSSGESHEVPTPPEQHRVQSEAAQPVAHDDQEVPNMEVEDAAPHDEEMQRVQEAAELAAERIRSSLNELTASTSADECQMTLQTLRTILSNIITQPSDSKYQRLRGSNAAFARKVGRYHSAVRLLNAVGFEQQTSGDLQLTRHDLGLLWLAQSLIDQAVGS